MRCARPCLKRVGTVGMILGVSSVIFSAKVGICAASLGGTQKQKGRVGSIPFSSQVSIAPPIYTGTCINIPHKRKRLTVLHAGFEPRLFLPQWARPRWSHPQRQHLHGCRLFPATRDSGLWAASVQHPRGSSCRFRPRIDCLARARE